jgi:hypothetical protein
MSRRKATAAVAVVLLVVLSCFVARQQTGYSAFDRALAPILDQAIGDCDAGHNDPSHTGDLYRDLPDLQKRAEAVPQVGSGYRVELRRDLIGLLTHIAERDAERPDEARTTETMALLKDAFLKKRETLQHGKDFVPPPNPPGK